MVTAPPPALTTSGLLMLIDAVLFRMPFEFEKERVALPSAVAFSRTILPPLRFQLFTPGMLAVLVVVPRSTRVPELMLKVLLVRGPS